MLTYESLVKDIERTAEEGVTLNEAEKLAGKALAVMNLVSSQLAEAEQDRRMRKQGVKSLRSAVRLEEVSKHEKKPTEGALEDAVNTDNRVLDEESSYDSAEVKTAELERQFGIAKEAHIYYRGVSKGRFE